jgi:basic membrane protein A
VVVSDSRGSRGSLSNPARTTRVTLVNNSPQILANQDPVSMQPIAGLRAAAHDFGVKASVVWGGYSSDGFQSALERAARRSDLVLVGATPFDELVAGVAQKFPATRFVFGGSVQAGPLAGHRNLTGLAFDDREAGQLAGYLAGLMVGRRGTVSAVGGLPVPGVVNLIDGFRKGAARANAGVHVLVGYSKTFVQREPCERLASRQIDRGSTVVFDVAGSCGFGAMAAAGIRGVWGIGVDADLSYLGPHILASAVKRVDRAEELAVKLFVDGTLPRGRDVRLGLATDSIGLVGISNRVPAAARVRLERFAAKLGAQDAAR